MIFTYAGNESEGLVVLEYVTSVARTGGTLKIETLNGEPVVLNGTPAAAKGLYVQIHAALEAMSGQEEASGETATTEIPRQARDDNGGSRDDRPGRGVDLMGGDPNL
jgi:hypothetical protein